MTLFVVIFFSDTASWKRETKEKPKGLHHRKVFAQQRQPTGWRQVSASDTSDKGRYPEWIRDTTSLFGHVLFIKLFFFLFCFVFLIIINFIRLKRIIYMSFLEESKSQMYTRLIMWCLSDLPSVWSSSLFWFLNHLWNW